jgi:hypothetical protein
MATKPHNSITFSALAATLLALAIGSAPIAVMLTLNERVGAEVGL